MGQESQPTRWEGKISARLTQASEDEIWGLFRDFFNVHRWIPGLGTSYGVHGSNGQVGCIRHCANFSFPSHGGGAASEKSSPPCSSWIEERLMAVDPVDRIMSYVGVDCNLGFKSYAATVKILPVDGQDCGCVIEWSFGVDPVEGWSSEMLVKWYEGVLQKMSKEMEDALAGQGPEKANSCRNKHVGLCNA